jgi:hypothetical protein
MRGKPSRGYRAWQCKDLEPINQTAGVQSFIMAASSEPTRDEKIADALRAAPAYIADSATVLDWDMTTVLREGSSDWTCVPTPPGKPWPAPMCLDPPFLQWFRDLMHGKTPRIDRIGISYMLLGEAGADFDDPSATQPPEGKVWYRAGPHVMFVFPAGTGRVVAGLGHDTASGLPYVRPIPGAEPLLVVPIAKPGEKVCGCPNECSCGCTT